MLASTLVAVCIEAARQSLVPISHANSAVVEAEIGRISGTEDGLTSAEKEANLSNWMARSSRSRNVWD